MKETEPHECSFCEKDLSKGGGTYVYTEAVCISCHEVLNSILEGISKNTEGGNQSD